MGAPAPPVAPVFAPATLKQALDGVLSLARAADRLPDAMRMLAEIEMRIGAVGSAIGRDRRGGTVGGQPAPRVAIATAVSEGEIVLGGRWVPDLAAAAGAEAVLVRAGEDDLSSTPAELARAGPALLVLALPGVHVAGALRTHGVLRASAGWQPLRRTPTVAIDGRRYVVAPGPSIVRAVELLAAAIHGYRPAPAPAPVELAACEPAPG